MKYAISKKSGKKFTIIEETELTIVIKAVDTMEEREIKQTTFKRGYEVIEEVDEEIVEEVQAELSSEIASTQEENRISRTLHILLADRDRKVEEVILESIFENPTGFSIEGLAVESEGLRLRDNARQCYKENENKFTNLREYQDEVATRVQNNPEDKFARDEYNSVFRDLEKYLSKMREHYSKYYYIKDYLNFLNESVEIEEGAEEQE